MGLRTFLGVPIYWHLTQSPTHGQGQRPGLLPGPPFNSVSVNPPAQTTPTPTSSSKVKWLRDTLCSLNSLLSLRVGGGEVSEVVSI